MSPCLRMGARMMSSSAPLAGTALTASLSPSGVHTLTLSSPKTRNALSLDLMRAMRAELAEHSDNPERRVVVIRAEGSVFSAGHNLKEMTDKEVDYGVFTFCKNLILFMLTYCVTVVYV